MRCIHILLSSSAQCWYLSRDFCVQSNREILFSTTRANIALKKSRVCRARRSANVNNNVAGLFAKCQASTYIRANHWAHRGSIFKSDDSRLTSIAKQSGDGHRILPRPQMICPRDDVPALFLAMTRRRRPALVHAFAASPAIINGDRCTPTYER